MLLPSDGLKQQWKHDCRVTCSVYWTDTKLMLYTQYEMCKSKCYNQKKRIESEKMKNCSSRLRI